MRSLATLLLLLSCGSMRTSASVFHVAVWGSDSSPGSAEAPFRTVMRGVAAAGPGDTVLVADGVYLHESSVTEGDQPSAGQASPVALNRSGAPDAWITIQAEHRWGAVLDCELQCDAYIDLRNAAYVSIQDFVITRGNKEGIHSNDAAHDIVLRGNRFEYIANRESTTLYGLDGVYISPKCHHFVIDRNVFHDIGRTNPGQLDHGLYIQGQNISVTNNTFYNIVRGWSIQLADGAQDLVIAGNTFLFPNESARGGQIMLWNRQSNVAIHDNVFYQPFRQAVASYQSTATGCSIDHNLVVGVPAITYDATACVLNNNTIIMTPGTQTTQ